MLPSQIKFTYIIKMKMSTTDVDIKNKNKTEQIN